MEVIFNPLSEESAVLVTGYPLTREELRILAAHWLTVVVGGGANASSNARASFAASGAS